MLNLGLPDNADLWWQGYRGMRLRDIIPKVNLMLKFNKTKPDILVVHIRGNDISRRPILALIREYNFKTLQLGRASTYFSRTFGADKLHITRKEITVSSKYSCQTLVKPYELLFVKMSMPVEPHSYDYLSILIISFRTIIKGTSASFVCYLKYSQELR